MSLVDIAITLAAAGAGGTVAWLAWRLSGVLKHLRPRRRPAAKDDPARSDTVQKPAPPRKALAAEQAVPMPEEVQAPPSIAESLRPGPERRVEPVAAPEVMDRLASLKADIATLAQAQLALLEGRAERESRLLAEMRAVAGTPELSAGLARIESALTNLSSQLITGDAPPAEPAQAPAARNEVIIEDAADQPPQPLQSQLLAPRVEGTRGRDDSLVSMLDHARNSPRTDNAAEAGLIGRRGLGPAE